MPRVRIVFDISMDGLARKLICVRSALLLTNRLPHHVQLKLESTSFMPGSKFPFTRVFSILKLFCHFWSEYAYI